LPGSYELFAFEESGAYEGAIYPGPVSVSAGMATPGVDFELSKGGQIAGTITDALSGAAIRFSWVCARDAVDGEIHRCDYSDGSGHYAIGGLPTGTYKVWFSPDVPAWEEEDDYFQQYYNGAPTFAGATGVSVIAPGVVAGIDARLVSRHAPPAPPAAGAAPPVAGAAPPPPAAKTVRPRPRCGKGKRLIKRKGKARCVKKVKRSAKPRRSGR
jgi:hypothetical protein